MSYKVRANQTFYRLFFTASFLLLGVAGLGIVALENYAGISIISTQSEIDRKALLLTLSIFGFLGLSTAFLMMYLMRERRNIDTDRRRFSVAERSIDRRVNVDRRTAQL